MVVAPLLLYSDDLSGNRSKQWNLFDVWCLLLAGLPKKLNHQLRHIHLLCASKEASISEFQKIASARGGRRTELKTASGLCDQQTVILELSIDAFR